MEVLYLKSQGLSVAEIARLTRVSETTVRSYLKEFLKGGVEALKPLKFRRQESALAEHRDVIREHFEKHPVAELKQASEQLYALTGIRGSPERVSKFLQRAGLRRRKAGSIPARADVEKQHEFLARELEPRLAPAKKGEREVFF